MYLRNRVHTVLLKAGKSEAQSWDRNLLDHVLDDHHFHDEHTPVHVVRKDVDSSSNPHSAAAGRRLHCGAFCADWCH